jgi:hypothetical protein
VALILRQNVLAVGGAAVVLALAPAAGLTAGGAAAAPARPAISSPSVTVRVEGLDRTLLTPTAVQTHAGSITRFHAPAGACSASSAAGALDAATHHKWGGTWSSSVGDYEITSILGERHSFTSKYYWSIWIDNRLATAGACGIKLHRGDQLLFAVEPIKTTEDPIAIQAPATAAVGHMFNVTVVSYSQKGKATPLAGATVSVAGHSGLTNSQGVVPLTPSAPGTFTLLAQHAGYIRAAPARVVVAG